MLWSEFIEGTGCRDNEHNYNVYKRLEYAYMNDDTFTKEEVYEWGKKLVNNELTEAQKEFNRSIKENIAVLEERYKANRYECDLYKSYARESILTEDRKYWNGQAKIFADLAKEAKAEIAKQKFLIIR